MIWDCTIYFKRDEIFPFKVARNSFHFSPDLFTNTFPNIVSLIVPT